MDLPFTESRAQLLANCKLLFGPETQVITLCRATNDYQAVAMRFDTCTTTWTKFLHTGNATSTYGAILSLLKETEFAVARKFSSSKNKEGLPFFGGPVVGMPVYEREGGGNAYRRAGGGSTASSDHSGFEFFPTPESSVAGREVVEDAPAEISAESAVASGFEVEGQVKDDISFKENENVQAPKFDSASEFAAVDDYEAKSSFGKQDIVAVEDTPAEPEAPNLVDEHPEECGPWDFSHLKEKKKAKSVTFPEPLDEEVPKAEETPLPDPEPEVVSDNIWGSFSSKKDKKNKKKKGMKVIFEEVCALPEPEESVIEEPEVEDCPMPEPEVVEEFGRGSFATKKNKKKKWKKAVSREECPHPEPIVDEDSKVEDCPAPAPVEDYPAAPEEEYPVPVEDYPAVREEEYSPPIEPEPEPTPEAYDVGIFFGSKKDKEQKKQKKGKIVIIEEDAKYPEPVPEELAIDAPLPPELEPEDSWGVFGTKKDKKKKSKSAIEEEISAPPPAPEDEWGIGWAALKKGKKGKKEEKSEPLAEEEMAIEEPAPEPEDPWSTWGFSGVKEKKKKGNIAEPIEMEEAILEEPVFVTNIPDLVEPGPPPPPEEPSVETIEVSPPPVIEEPTINATPGITTASIEPSTAQTIVLKIRHNNSSGQQILRAMVLLEESTSKGICLAVNSYLNRKVSVNFERTITIRSGAGKDGDLDLSGVDVEGMWPEYLDYFRQCTKFPELTVNVVDG